MRCLAAVVLALGLGGCDLARPADAVDAALGLDGPPPIDPDVVPPIGSPSTLDVACWNLEWFPKSDRTIGRVADLIVSLDLDLVIFEEIASIEAWNDLVARLPDHEGLLSSHRYSPTEYQKIGFIYRTGLVTLGPPELLFVADGYSHPRPPMKVHVDAAGLSFDAIGLHLKAGTSMDDAARRLEAMQDLDAHVRAQIEAGGEDEVIILGDYNDVVTTSWGRDVLAPMLAAPDRYRFLSEEAALAGARSFLPSNKVIDHIVVTAGLFDELGAVRAVIPKLETMVPRYDAELSDHLPVIVSIPQP